MSKAPLGQMIIELGLDSTDFGKGLTSAKREVRTWSNEMSASMRAADFAGNKIGKLQARHEGLTKIITAQQKQVDSLKKSYDNSFVDGKPTAQTEKLASQLKKAEANLITYQSELRTTAGELAKMRVQTEGFTGWLNNTGKGLQKFGKGATTVGNTLTKYFTVPLVAGVTLATKAAMDWESAFAGVIKTSDELVDVNGNVVYSYQDLEDGLRDLAKQLPATHTEIAAVGEAAGQLGIQTDNITSFTKTMIDLGESTNMSAETAATSLARFANITNMSQKDFDRLGSSIVELGNNFATTEAEITALAMRLAGAGSQIGLSEADILGLAAALSSVGIEAEMGGSALSKTMINMAVASETGLNAVADLENATGMTRRELELMSSNASKDFKAVADSLGMTSTEVNKIIKAGKDLEGFSAVAGMTSEQFVKAFQEDAVGALGAFIEGLGAAEEKGTTAIALLDELGISEVRLRDALLRAGNASELFADSVKMSNDAWEENTALTIEAQQRYDTLESQLGMLRNEAVDIAITFGGPFVAAFKEALEVARPFIGSMADLAQSFADADPKTQQMILKMIGFGIAVGPVTRTVGGFSTTIGNATVKTVDFLAEMAKKKTIDDFSGAAVTASGAKGIGAMTSVLGTLNPLLIGLVGAGGLLAVGYGAWKLWGEEAYEAGQRTKRWGIDVGEATDDVLAEIQDTSGKYGLMTQGIDIGSESMVESFKKVGSSIETDLIERLAATEEYLSNLPEVLRGSQEEILQDNITHQEEALQLLEKNNAEIVAIEQKALKERGELNELEMAAINAIQQESVDAYITAINLSAEEERSIRSALSGDIKEIGRETAQNLLVTLGESNAELEIMRREQLEADKEQATERGVLNEKLYEELSANTNAYYDALGVTGKRTIRDIIGEYDDLVYSVNLATGEIISAHDRTAMGEEHYQEIVRNNIAIVEQYGEAQKKSSSEAADAVDWLVDRGRAGAETWNGIVVESGGNMDKFKEGIFEAAKTAEGWNHIRFQIHEANLDSNARLIIAEAAIQNGYWDGMAWEDKQAILKDNFSEVVYKAIEDSGVWNSLTFEEQQAVLRNEFSDTMIQALMDFDVWNNLKPEEQKAVLLTNSSETLIQILKDFGQWEKLDPNVKNLIANNEPAKKEVREAKRVLDEYGNIIVKAPVINVKDNVTSEITRLQQRINQLRGKTVYVDAIARAGGSASSRAFIQSGGSFLEKGTNYHPGGPAIVNDQKGSTFRELVVEADGTSYIPYGRNVLIPNLSRGAKVLKASLTKQRFPEIPQYAGGIGNIPVESTVIQSIKNTRSTINETKPNLVNNFSSLETLLAEILKLLNRPDEPIEVPVYLDKYEIARATRDPIDRELGTKNRDKNLSKGRV